MAVRACGVLCCPVEALAPSPPCGGLGAELSALDTFAGIADNVQSVRMPRLKPRPPDPASPRGLAGSAALDMPGASVTRTPSPWGAWPQRHRGVRTG